MKSRNLKWGIIASTIKSFSAVLHLFIFIRYFSTEEYAYWTILAGIYGLITVIDFGFGPAFLRALTQVFNGSTELKTFGISQLNNAINICRDDRLYNRLLSAIKSYYFGLTITITIFLGIFGTIYLHKSDYINIYEITSYDLLVWAIVLVLISYSVFSYYYPLVLQSIGEISSERKFAALQQVIGLLIFYIFANYNLGIIGYFSAQFIAMILYRIKCKWLIQSSYESFNPTFIPLRKILINLKAIIPVALKSGVVGLSAFIVSRLSTFIIAFSLSKELTSQYGLTFAIISVLSLFSRTYITVQFPELTKLRTFGNIESVSELYIRNNIFIFASYLIGAVLIFSFGDGFLIFIDSELNLLSSDFVIIMIVASLLESLHASAGQVILTDNRIPFFIPAVFSGIGSVVLMWVLLKFDLGLYAIVLAPALSQLAYQNWRWPYVVHKELAINLNTYKKTISNVLQF